MNKSAGTRRKGVRRKASNPNRASPQGRSKLFTFTVDAETARVVKVETVDASGASHEISDEETANLAHPGSQKLEEALEEAFEAGIDCVLGGGEEEGQNETQESEKDAELRHALLTQLIEHSPAKRLLQRETMNRMLLETLIQQSTKATAGPAASA